MDKIIKKQHNYSFSSFQPNLPPLVIPAEPKREQESVLLDTTNILMIKTLKTCTILLFIMLMSCAEKEDSITIAVASNFESTLKTIIAGYKNTHPDENIQIISASSGILSNQILNNAPFDLFLSADTQKPELIFNTLQLNRKPTIYAVGQLILWIPLSSGNQCLQKLSTLKTLALANPKIAPYGKVAEKILNDNSIKVDKIIQTSNAAQAYIYTKDKLTEAGFVPYSFVKNETVGCMQLFNTEELSQSMLLLNDSALNIYEYIASKNTQETIKSAGYK